MEHDGWFPGFLGEFCTAAESWVDPRQPDPQPRYHGAVQRVNATYIVETYFELDPKLGFLAVLRYKDRGLVKIVWVEHIVCIETNCQVDKA
eukprot:scaffold3033_cov250-Chaetoceros_neogracile.AAC.4